MPEIQDEAGDAIRDEAGTAILDEAGVIMLLLVDKLDGDCGDCGTMTA